MNTINNSNAKSDKIKPSLEALKPFPFERLPPELRNKIYGYVFAPIGSTILIVRTPNYRYRSSPGFCTQILQVSRKVHNEAAAILYTGRTFNFGHFSYSSASAMGYFLKRLPSNYRDLIEHIALPRLRLHIYSQVGIKTLHTCRGLKTLHLRMCLEIYELAWGGGGKSYVMSEADGIKELLLVRGLQKLVLLDESGIYPGHYLAKTKEKLDSLLQSEMTMSRQTSSS